MRWMLLRRQRSIASPFPHRGSSSSSSSCSGGRGMTVSLGSNSNRRCFDHRVVVHQYSSGMRRHFQSSQEHFRGSAAATTSTSSFRFFSVTSTNNNDNDDDDNTKQTAEKNSNKDSVSSGRTNDKNASAPMAFEDYFKPNMSTNDDYYDLHEYDEEEDDDDDVDLALLKSEVSLLVDEMISLQEEMGNHKVKIKFDKDIRFLQKINAQRDNNNNNDNYDHHHHNNSKKQPPKSSSASTITPPPPPPPLSTDDDWNIITTTTTTTTLAAQSPAQPPPLISTSSEPSLETVEQDTSGLLKIFQSQNESKQKQQQRQELLNSLHDPEPYHKLENKKTKNSKDENSVAGQQQQQSLYAKDFDRTLFEAQTERMEQQTTTTTTKLQKDNNDDDTQPQSIDTNVSSNVTDGLQILNDDDDKKEKRMNNTVVVREQNELDVTQHNPTTTTPHHHYLTSSSSSSFQDPDHQVVFENTIEISKDDFERYHHLQPFPHTSSSSLDDPDHEIFDHAVEVSNEDIQEHLKFPHSSSLDDPDHEVFEQAAVVSEDDIINEHLKFPKSSSLHDPDQSSSLFSSSSSMDTTTSGEWYNSTSSSSTSTSTSSNAMALSKALILLRNLSQRDWAAFDQSTLDDDDDDNIDKNDLQEELNNDDNDDDDDDDDDDEKVVFENDNNTAEDYSGDVFLVQSILKRAQQGDVALSTEDYNLVLAHLALSPELAMDDILDLMMQTYLQMKQFTNLSSSLSSSSSASAPDDMTSTPCAPDSVTFEIMVLALTRRLLSFSTALKFVSEELLHPKKNANSNMITWSPKLVEAILELCEKRRDYKLAKRVLSGMMDAEDNHHQDKKKIKTISLKGKVSKKAYLSLLNLMMSANAMEEGAKVIELSLESSSRRFDKNLDKILIQALAWPTKNRKGDAIDNTFILEHILTLIDNHPKYSPGFHVWKHFIMSSAKGAQHNDKRWHLVTQAFSRLVANNPSYWPDHALLRHGIEASSALKNSKLAADLISRAALHEQKNADQTSTDFSDTVDRFFATHDKQAAAAAASSFQEEDHHLKFPFKDVMRAMQICVDMKDVQSCRVILNSVNAIKQYVLPTNMHSLCGLGLKAFARAGEPELAEKLISYMTEIDLEPGEESYGSVIEALGVAGRIEDSKQLLEAMESGQIDNVVPGPSCYDGFFHACARNEDWDDILTKYNSMSDFGIAKSPASRYYHLLAAYKQKGRAEGKEILKNLLLENVDINTNIYSLALQIVIPDVVKDDQAIHFADIRPQLREMSLRDDKLKNVGLELVRSLRLVELEDDRQPSAGLGIEDIQKRRQEVRQNLIKDLLAFDEQREIPN